MVAERTLNFASIPLLFPRYIEHLFTSPLSSTRSFLAHVGLRIFFFQPKMSSQLLDVPHEHPSSILSFADNALTLVREAVFTAGYAPLTSRAENAAVSCEFRSVCFNSFTLIPTEPSAFYETSPSVVYELSPASVPMSSLNAVRVASGKKSCKLS